VAAYFEDYTYCVYYAQVDKGNKTVRYGESRSVTATSAAKNFGRLVDAVRESRAEFIVERGGVGVARIAPFIDRSFSGRDLVELLRRVPGRDDEFGREVEAGRARTNTPEVPKDPWAS
jgi:hypothetical protein